MATTQLPGQKKDDYKFPSHFGSHSSMIDKDATSYLFGGNADVSKELRDEADDLLNSHSDLALATSTEATGEELKAKLLVLRDEFGLYITEKSQLDQTCDPNRYKQSRLGKLFQSHKKDEEKKEKK